MIKYVWMPTTLDLYNIIPQLESQFFILQGYLCFTVYASKLALQQNMAKRFCLEERGEQPTFRILALKDQFMRLFQNNILKINRSHIKSQLLISSLLHSRKPDLKISYFFPIMLNHLYSVLHFDSKFILLQFHSILLVCVRYVK